MEIKESHAQLVRLQDQFPSLNNIQFQGLHLWPFIRYNELERFKKQQYSHVDLPRRRVPPADSFIKRFVFKRRVSNSLNNLIDQHLGAPRIGFMSFGTSYYSEKVDGRVYNRHLDPFVEAVRKLVSRDVETVKIHPDKDRGLDMLHDATFLPMDAVKALAHYYFKPSTWHENEMSSFKENLLEMGLGAILDRSIGDLEDCLSMLPVAEMILKRLNLSHLFVVCFYDLEVLPFVVAAKKMGIKVIDIQHGKQGQIHHIYSHNPMVHQMKEMYPDVFWNWGKSSAEAIDVWFSDKSNSPMCIPGGNLFTQNWLNDDFEANYSGNTEIRALVKRYGSVVLFCGDPIEETFPEVMVKYIAQNPEVLVLVRLHPAMKNRIAGFKKQLPFENVEISISTAAPLYAMLKAVDCLITAWSSVCIEGLVFNLPSILIHKNGVDLYQSYIDKGFFKYCSSAEAISDGLKDFKVNVPVIQDDFIETDVSVATEYLKKIISQ
jgi:hypothetical protein